MRQLHFGNKTLHVLLGLLAIFCFAGMASAQELVGLYRSKSDAYSAVIKKARSRKCDVDAVTVKGKINGIRGSFKFSNSGDLSAAYIYGNFSYKDEQAAAISVRKVASKLSCSPEAIVFSAKIGGKSGLYEFDSDGRPITGKPAQDIGLGTPLVVSNDTRHPALIKVWATKDKEVTVSVPPNENLTLHPYGDPPLIKVRQGPPGSYVYWGGALPTGAGRGQHIALTLKDGAFPEKVRITKEQFGDETVSEGTGSVTEARKPKPPPRSSCSSKKPKNTGEVTVILPNGAHFTGLLVIETDEFIKIKTKVAEMQWTKKQVKEILRFEE